MSGRAGLVFAMAAACATAGCMSHFETVKTTRTPLGVHIEKPLPGLPLMLADVEVHESRLLVWLRLLGTCGVRQDVRVTERRVMRIRASEGRYVPVVLLLIAAGVAGSLAATQKNSGYRWMAGAYGSGAVLYWAVPLLAERDKTLGESAHYESRELAPVSCALQPLADVRVTLRAGGRTLEQQTDAHGTASFAGVTSARGIELFVEDRAVHAIVVHGPVH